MPSADALAVPTVVDLYDPAAVDAAIVGAKAAALARCSRAGLAILPGFVLTTAAAERGADDPSVIAPLRRAWNALRAQQDAPLVVRSSSTVEDAAESSMAGQFTSVLDVRDWASFHAAVVRVLDSARHAPAAGPPQPMAVLVQPQLDLVVGGVMFGIDPVTGARRHVVVDAVAGRVADLVGGRVTAAHYVLSRRGRLLEVVHAEAAPRLRRSRRRELVHVARAAQRVFGTAQDLEWAIDRDGRLWLLQSRPVTAVPSPPSKVLLGPGPVGETFPHPLRTLEADLWIEPLREAIVRTLLTTRAVPGRRVRSSPVLTTVRGRAAVDLELLGVVCTRRSLWRRLDPRPGARRLLAAWRVGRLRVALPTLASDLVEAVDEDLAAVGMLADRTEADLLRLLDAGRRELATVHAMEMLVGMLCDVGAADVALPVVAMQALRDGRAEGLGDVEVVARWPVVLALVPPSLDRTGPLPRVPAAVPNVETYPDVESLGSRDALRLRTRWLQELLARIARELAYRVSSRGVVPDATMVRDCTIEELSRLVRGGEAPRDLELRATVRPGPPLPTVFRLSSRGDVLPRVTGETRDGIPAGGGRGAGIVRHSIDGALDGADTVLVVVNLEPELAPALPGLAGLVAETGSPLSHLAILAREMHVPTVVAVPDARHRFPCGTRVVVDGTTGEISKLSAEVTP
jgi:pyruvate,water dikinase